MRFPSPQVGSGQEFHQSYAFRQNCFHPLKSGRDPKSTVRLLTHAAWFPSPQVGSGRVSSHHARGGAGSFHPLKSGRDCHLQRFRSCHFQCFHPLKSGRDGLEKFPVGVNTSGFHPLKSGRDRASSGVVPFKSKVSIPSSRVGTRFHHTARVRSSRFPSPQVGSGLATSQTQRYKHECFHPLKSGRDHD